MRRLLFALLLLTFSCKSHKSTKRIVTTKSNRTESPTTKHIPESEGETTVLTPKNTNTPNETTLTPNLALDIVTYAKQFDGVKYKFGGTTENGMDCSGLVYTAFKAHDIYLPRISRDMAKKGEKVTMEDVKEGDLLFFHTGKTKVINHVGLVTASRPGYVEFIHATTRAGVIVSSLAERYWYTSFVEARRIL